jgi:sec-independent protein translocase protein TatA
MVAVAGDDPSNRGKLMIAIGMPNGFEWLILLLVVLLLFGHRLPGMARSLGSGITEFKRGLKEGNKPSDASGSGGSSSTPPARGTDTPSDGAAR